MSITKELYDEYVLKSFLTEKNFSGKYDSKTLSDNMIPFNKLKEFHYQTSFFLNFYASLYTELKEYEKTINYNITKFTKTIENLGIIIDNSTQNMVSTFSNNNFTFYVNSLQYSNISITGSGNTMNHISENIIFKFINNGSITPNIDLTCDILIVGGGGGGGGSNNSYEYGGGGGGGGGVGIGTINLKKDITYNIIIGSGGIIDISSGTPLNGYNTTIIGGDINEKAYGGGSGTENNGDNGGSGGGAGCYDMYSRCVGGIAIKGISASLNNSTNIIYYGNIGGKSSNRKNGGGGGGAGVAGSNSTNTKGGNGGNGILSNITGEDKYYGGGGGGGYMISDTNSIGGIGGLGGGGGYNGSLDGEANTGGGGAGGIKADKLFTTKFSGNGGSGIVVIRYKNINKQNIILGSNKNLLSNESSYLNYLILKDNGIKLTNSDILNKENYKKITNVNTSKFKEIIEEILSQTPENIFGYLLYKKIYYNIIIFNISIQNAIRVNYLNDSVKSIIDEDDISNIEIKNNCLNINSCINLNNIKDYIIDNTKNVIELNKIHFINTNNDYIIEKNQYINKINTYNSLNNEYKKTQDKLNISIKLYNQQYNNYIVYKKQSIYIIIFLIIIIISIIIISIFSLFSNTINNIIYLVLIIVLIIFIINYYINSKNINIKENFSSLSLSSSYIDSGVDNYIILKNIKNINNHKKFYNNLIPYINVYSNAYNELMNILRQNIYTSGNKSFSQDSNIIIYNNYLEKKNQIANNNIKLTNLFNMIEVIKKQINYLYNIIFIISCFILILLISLILYSFLPRMKIIIIILSVILISILIIYFAFVIIQPTRMIANKNYWAIINPSITTKSKL